MIRPADFIHISLQDAVLCAECNSISNSKRGNGGCFACGGSASGTYPLDRLIDHTPIPQAEKPKSKHIFRLVAAL